MLFDEKYIDYKTAKKIADELGKQRGAFKGKRFDDRDRPERVDLRRRLLHPKDDLGIERILGERDLVGINFLTRGVRASRAVCRIKIRDRHGNPCGFGTGFLVAPGLLLTNHHVLRNADSSRHSIAEFDYELDENFVPRKMRQFALTPETAFFNDSLLDFCFVGVAAFADDDTPLTDYGCLRLIPDSGKGVPGEAVTLVQHPEGEMKQIVIRKSEIQQLPGYDASTDSSFIHYTSDTERGSSGAPVLNDQWDVVALHHKAVPKYDDEGRVLSADGDVWVESMGENRIAWIANEGVRISAIFRALQRAAGRDDAARRVVYLLSADKSAERRISPMLAPRRRDDDVGEAAPFEASDFDGVTGYDKDFLDVEVPLPLVVGDWASDVAKLDDGSSVLNYLHFSVIMSDSRRLAYLTAVNIDGKTLQRPTKKPRWRTDPRMAKSLQSDNALYKNDPSEPFDLQRGHLVRRLDPVWGADMDEVNRAVDHTYHYTNAAPQERSFNDTVWGDLEDFVLGRAIDTDHRVTVFSGPIYDDINDPFYRHDADGGPYQIPLEYWKVVVFVREDGTLSASAYRQQQTDVTTLIEAKLTKHGFHPLSADELETVQMRIADLEDLTSIDFGELKAADPLDGLEATFRKHRIFGPSDLML